MTDNQRNRNIIKRVLEGEDKNSVFQEYRNEIGDYPLAKLLSQCPDYDLSMKYRTLNSTLIVLLIIGIAMKMISLVSMVVSSGLGVVGIVLAILLGPLINLVILYVVSLKNALIYKVMGILYVSAILRSMDIEDVFSYQSLVDILWASGSLILYLAISFLSFYIGFKMFPHFGWFKAKKEENGIPVYTTANA